METSALQQSIEFDLSERTRELLFYHNQLQKAENEDERDLLRRPLILLLYAHYEGFTKFSFDAYVAAINAEQIKCKEASSAMVASSLAEVFKELRQPQAVSDIFRGAPPDDSKLMRFARERQFVDVAYDLLERTVVIPDDVLNTESNLNVSVLRKFLFRLGLDPTLFDEHAPHINELVMRRNLIAHGVDRAGVTAEVYSGLRDRILKVMSGIMRSIVQAARDELYKRRAS